MIVILQAVGLLLDPTAIVLCIVIALLARGWVSLLAGAVIVGAVWAYVLPEFGATVVLSYAMGSSLVYLIRRLVRKRPKPVSPPSVPEG